jgi:hypothetical protein
MLKRTMKRSALILAASVLLLCSCGGPADDDNKGAQADQDYPSNRDNTVSTAKNQPGTQQMQDTDSLNVSGMPPNQAPNNGNGDPQKTIHGQSGTNQTGQGK